MLTQQSPGRVVKRSSGPAPFGGIVRSDRKQANRKNPQYRDPKYETFLAINGSFMNEFQLGISDTSRSFLRTLLSMEIPVPEQSLFRDDIFKDTCVDMDYRNEARVTRDITPLIVPSAETLAICGDTNLSCLVEGVDEGWNSCIPLTEPRPQPDYCVGFKREAFTDDQLGKLSHCTTRRPSREASFFMASYLMYFPFLTCEVKCGSEALDTADRQNAHSMTVAVRAVVELFRLVGREAELNREVLAFSISHDNRMVRIFGTYPVIEGGSTKYYRHPIHEFCFRALDGKERWTSYQFVRSIYDVWMPQHLRRICEAIDQLPSDGPGTA